MTMIIAIPVVVLGVALVRAVLCNDTIEVCLPMGLAGLAVGWLAGLTNTAVVMNLLTALLATAGAIQFIPVATGAASPTTISPVILAVVCVSVASGFTVARWIGPRSGLAIPAPAQRSPNHP